MRSYIQSLAWIFKKIHFALNVSPGNFESCIWRKSNFRDGWETWTQRSTLNAPEMLESSWFAGGTSYLKTGTILGIHVRDVPAYITYWWEFVLSWQKWIWTVGDKKQMHKHEGNCTNFPHEESASAVFSNLMSTEQPPKPDTHKHTTYIYYLALSSFILQQQNQDRLVQLDWPLM